MKRRLTALGTALALALILSISGIMVCLAGESVGSDTIEEWDLKIPSYANTLSILDGNDGCYYIYPAMERGIPYVMVYVYDGFADEESFFDSFTPFLGQKYDDLEVISDLTPITIDGDTYYELDYIYTVNDELCLDRRIARLADGRIYMFASKELPASDMGVGTLLEDTIADCVFLAEEDVEDVTVEEPYVVPEDISFETKSLYWTDVEDEVEASGIEGDFYYFDEIDAKMWIPYFLEEKTLTDANRDAGYIAYFIAADDSEDFAIGVQYFEAGITEDEYVEALQEALEIDDMSEFIINDIPFIVYSLPDNDVLVLGTITMEGAVFEASFYPLSNSEFIDAMEIVAASIQGA